MKYINIIIALILIITAGCKKEDVIDHDTESTWEIVDVDINHDWSIFHLEFLNEMDGFATILDQTGWGVNLFKTTDGGETWTKIRQAISSFCFVNNSLGYAIDDYNYTFIKTTDAGASWTEVPGISKDAEFVHFTGSKVLVFERIYNNGTSSTRILESSTPDDLSNLTEVAYIQGSVETLFAAVKTVGEATFVLNHINDYPKDTSILYRYRNGVTDSLILESDDWNYYEFGFSSEDEGMLFSKLSNYEVNFSTQEISTFKYSADRHFIDAFHGTGLGTGYLASQDEGIYHWDGIELEETLALRGRPYRYVEDFTEARDGSILFAYGDYALIKHRN